MKPIHIFALPSHQTTDRTSGVDYARVLLPMEHIDGYSVDDLVFHVDIYDIHAQDKMTWEEIADYYDLVFLNYTVLDWQYAAMGSFVHGKNKKIVMDIDDAIWYLRPDNVTYHDIKEMDGAYKISCMLDDVDGVTVTNSYLRNVLVDKTNRYHEDVNVMPNCIDLSLYSHKKKYQEKDTITLLHYGSTTHFEDLLQKTFVGAIDKIFKEYPQVVLKTVGSFIPELRYKWGPRYSNDFGAVDIYDWVKNKFPGFMDEADIFLAPLEDDIYNRCKSDIKFVEVSSAGVPGVYGATRPYKDTIEHGVTGYVAQSEDDWYTSIKELIDDKKKRETIGNNAYEWVKDNRQMKNNVEPYINLFRRVLDI